MEDRVDLEGVQKFQIASSSSNYFQHLEWSNPLVVKLLAWPASSDVLGV